MLLYWRHVVCCTSINYNVELCSASSANSPKVRITSSTLSRKEFADNLTSRTVRQVKVLYASVGDEGLSLFLPNDQPQLTPPVHCPESVTPVSPHLVVIQNQLLSLVLRSMHVLMKRTGYV